MQRALQNLGYMPQLPQPCPILSDVPADPAPAPLLTSTPLLTAAVAVSSQSRLLSQRALTPTQCISAALPRDVTPPPSPSMVASPRPVNDQPQFFSPRHHSVNDALHDRSHSDSSAQRASSVDAFEYSDDSSQQPTS